MSEEKEWERELGWRLRADRLGTVVGTCFGLVMFFVLAALFIFFWLYSKNPVMPWGGHLFGP